MIWRESEGGLLSAEALVGRTVREYVPADQAWGRYGRVTAASEDGVFVLWAGADSTALADPMGVCVCSRDELMAELIRTSRALDLGRIPMLEGAGIDDEFIIAADAYNEWLGALERAEGLGFPPEPREPAA